MKRITALLMSLLVAGCLFSSGCAQSEEETETVPVTVVNDVQTEETDETDTFVSDDSKPDKTETVYVTADAYGNPEETKVETVLKAVAEGETVTDYTILDNIKNKDGGEEFTLSDDGTLVWENLGNRIEYEGTTDKALPVSVKITYYLEGKEMTRDEIAGRSGNVKIRIDYTNNTSETVKVNGVNCTTVTPFTAMTAVMMSDDNFTNIKVENGTVMTSGDSAIVIGIALPGLTDSLKLSSYELTEDIDIPEYVEITAYAKDFEISYTATVISTGLFEDIENSDLKKLDEFADDIDDMKDGVQDMKDATSELYDGTSKFAEYLTEYIDGADSVSDYARAAAQVFTQTDTLSQSITSLSAGLSALYTQLSAIDVTALDSDTRRAVTALTADVASLQTSAGNISADVRRVSTYKTALDSAVSALDSIDYSRAQNSITARVSASLDANGIDADTKRAILAGIDTDSCIADVKSQIASAKANIQAAVSSYDARVAVETRNISTAVRDIETQAGILSQAADEFTAIASVKDSVNSVRESAAALSQGATRLSSALTQMTRASQTIVSTDAAAQLKTAGTRMETAAKSLKDGVKAFRDGLADFDISDFESLGGDNLRLMKRRILALKEADILYDNFGGKADGQTSDVSFIIETAEIKAE